MKNSFAISIPTNHEYDVHLSIYTPEKNRQPAPLIIMIPGFLGFIKWGFYPHLAKLAQKEGFIFASINHSTGGSKGVGRPYTNLKSLEDMSIQKDIDDVQFVIEYLQNNQEQHNLNIDMNRIGLIGHSKGGAIGILYAKSNPLIKSLVTINTISKFIRVPQEKIDEIIKAGFKEKKIPGTMKKVKVKKGFWEELIQSGEKYNIVSAMSSVKAKTLLIHSIEDDKVPYEESEELHLANKNSELKKYKNVDHFLNCPPVCRKLDSIAIKIVTEVISWHKKQLF